MESTVSGIAAASALTANVPGNNTKARRPPKRLFAESDRLFSLSSYSSPASKSIDLRTDALMIREQEAGLQNGIQKVFHNV